MNDDSKGDKPNRPYEVGHGRPPKATQFKSGVSPNPKGRPKGSRNFSTDLREALDERVTMNANGKRKKIRRRKAAALHVANKAASGDPKAISIVMQHETHAQKTETNVRVCESEIVSAADELVMRSIIERIRQSTAAPEDSSEISTLRNENDHVRY